MVARLKELEDENRRLKKMVAEVQLQADVLKGTPKNSSLIAP